ncbi:hypothetical protein L249_8486 [Ophiocordyceps polyrhachis-furcata BCC 54312]|uniref:Uncharacterized protein n=1 Tax=Ophiocordyceps polyrhachis-furcata BCC 54312 TaxID=1330021 RepID=A0A367L798_9HYPO|nr:hypothetical protein L249_8486 [Ophiocordyceps polyrhachis-furcata BCC 54312]
MSRPPTPVSSCPLRRLQVRAGTETSVYEAAQFAGDMVLTLDGQRSLSSGRDCLMLVVHCARRNMLSIRLSDLLLHHHDAADSVGADRSARQLTIRVPSQQHEVRASFEHARDFNLSLCMLSKSGFTIRDETPTSVSLDSSQASVDLAPRLSSITPLPYGPEPQKPWTLATLLDCASVPPQSPAELMQNVPSSLSSSPVLNTSSRQSMSSSVFNPYNLFTKNQSGNLYQPRVASPLRNSFLPNEQGHEAGSVATTAVRGSENLIRSASSTMIRDHDDPALFSASSSVCSATESATGDWATPGAVEEQTLVAQSFRDLMPQRRHLPFAPERKADVSPSNDRAKRVRQRNGDDDRLSLTTGIGSFSGTPVESRHGRQGGQNDVGQIREPDGSRQCFANSEDQGDSTHGGTGLFRETRASLLVPRTSGYVRHTVVLTDPLMLRQLSNLTAGIFEQYQADVSRGCDEALCAQFYLERLQSQRRDFWLSQLTRRNDFLVKHTSTEQGYLPTSYEVEACGAWRQASGCIDLVPY